MIEIVIYPFFLLKISGSNIVNRKNLYRKSFTALVGRPLSNLNQLGCIVLLDIRWCISKYKENIKL